MMASPAGWVDMDIADGMLRTGRVGFDKLAHVITISKSKAARGEGKCFDIQ